MRGWIDIAKLAHTKNLNGGLVARGAAGLPFVLYEGLELAVVPPQIDLPRTVHVLYSQERNQGETVVFFQEITDASTAKALVGSHLLARLSDIDMDMLAAESDEPDWEGWRVVDRVRGEIGQVKGIETPSVQSLLVVERPDGSETLIPLVDEFIEEISEECRSIAVDLPEGLLDL